jgi:hemoglobin
MQDTLYELAGGATGVRQLAEAFYRRVFADPIMLPLFHNPNDDHVGRMALWLGEFFGGPPEHSRQRGGFTTLFGVHHRLEISDVQRDHWIMHMLAACEEVHLPSEVIDYFKPHIYFGARAAQGLSGR